MFKKNNFRRRDRRSQATDVGKKFLEGSVTIRTGGKEITIRNVRKKSEKSDYKKKRNIGFDYGAIGRGMR